MSSPILLNISITIFWCSALKKKAFSATRRNMYEEMSYDNLWQKLDALN